MSLNSLLDQDVTVLTASRRLAHAVRLGFARYAQQQGLTVWRTPRALPWSAWLRQQHLEARSGLNQHSPGLRVLTPAQTRVLWDDIVARSRLAADLLNPSSAARLAARSWRKLQDYQIPIEPLESFDTAEAQALSTWCREFTRRCAALDAIDEARLAAWAFDSGFIPRERLALAGFDVMPPAMSQLIEHWRSHGQVVEIDDAPRSDTSLVVIGAPDLESEIDLAAQWARDQVQAGATNVGVIVPDLQRRRDELRRVFEDVLAPATRHTQSPATALPVVIAAPAPLTSYPMIDTALLVLQLAAGDATSTQAGRILRSPFLAGGVAERAARALADLRLREEQRERWDWFKLERWAGVTGCGQLALAARELNGILRSIASSASASEWAARFHSLWLSSGWPGDRTLNSVEHQTLLKFQEALAEFGALDVVAGQMSLGRALGRLHDLLGDTLFEPETVGAAITVVDAATSAGMQFDALWVAGLDADRWPAAVNPDPLIPLGLQQTANIPESSATGVLQLAVTQLQRWTTSAQRVVLSWPERDGDIELGCSPLIARWRTTPTTVLSTGQTISLRRMLFNERPVLETLRDDRAPMLSGEAARGGSRTIELQSRCPFRAQAELRLRAQPLPRISLGVEPVDRGAILHRVLADLWGILQSRQRLLAIDDVALELQVRESAQRHAMQALVPDTAHRTRLAILEIESIVRQILRLLALEKLRPPFTVDLAEAAEQYTIGGLSITLRPDRIDVLEGGGELLIDYKLGAAHRQRDWFDALPGRPRRPQLPLYGLAHADRLRGIAYVVLAPGAVEYRGWSDGTPMGPGVMPYPSGIRIDLGDPGDWDALLHHWSFTLTRLAQRYVAGDAAVNPLPQECAICHLSTLCRIHESPMNGRGIANDIGPVNDEQ